MPSQSFKVGGEPIQKGNINPETVLNSNLKMGP